jgi:hypothetical protein
MHFAAATPGIATPQKALVSDAISSDRADNGHGIEIVFRSCHSIQVTEMKIAAAFLMTTFSLLPLTTGTLAQTNSPPLPCSTCKAAPGPIIGAGLPLLAAGGIGYGVY